MIIYNLILVSIWGCLIVLGCKKSKKSLTTVTFLDVTLHKDIGNPTLQYTTHIKPTNKQLHVKYDSHHPLLLSKVSLLGKQSDIVKPTPSG